MNSAKCSTSSCGDRPRAGDDVSPGAQLLEVLAERVHVGRRGARPVTQRPVIAVSVSGSAWIAVRCMWCSTPRMPPISSPPPARPGPPCTSAGSGEPCPVDSLASRSFEDQQPAVPRRDAEHDLAGERRVGGDDRADQAALPARGQLDRPARCVAYGITVDTGPNASTSCGSARSGSATQQDRREERAALGVGVDDLDLLRVAEHDPAGVGQRLERSAGPPRAAPGWPARPSARPRSAGLPTSTSPAARTRPRPRRPACCGGHERAADRGALLPGLDRHLGDELLDVQVELGRAGRGVRAEDRAVQRVGLGVEPDRARRRASGCVRSCRRGRRRAGERRRRSCSVRWSNRSPTPPADELHRARRAAGPSRRSARPAWRSGTRSGWPA